MSAAAISHRSRDLAIDTCSSRLTSLQVPCYLYNKHTATIKVVNLNDNTFVENQDILYENLRDGTSTEMETRIYQPRGSIALRYAILSNDTRSENASSAYGRSHCEADGVEDREMWTKALFYDHHRLLVSSIWSAILPFIDLSCVFEHIGNSRTNHHDLRSFYFQADDVEDCEMWTKALFSDHHSGPKKQSFQLPLQIRLMIQRELSKN